VSRTNRKPQTLTILTKPMQRQLVRALNFQLRLIDHAIGLADQDSDPLRRSFLRESLRLEAKGTRSLIAKLGGREIRKETRTIA
jgi:hypothetical protein